MGETTPTGRPVPSPSPGPAPPSDPAAEPERFRSPVPEAAPSDPTPTRPRNEFTLPVDGSGQDGTKIKAEPLFLRSLSSTFSGSGVHGSLEDAQYRMADLQAVARPGEWPSAKNLAAFLEQAGGQLVRDFATMQKASMYLSDALAAVAQLQEDHESERTAAGEDFGFGEAVGKLQQSMGAGPGIPAQVRD